MLAIDNSHVILCLRPKGCTQRALSVLGKREIYSAYVNRVTVVLLSFFPLILHCSKPQVFDFVDRPEEKEDGPSQTTLVIGAFYTALVLMCKVRDTNVLFRK